MKPHQSEPLHDTPFRVLIVEDSAMLMTRLSGLVGEIPGVVVEGEAGTRAEADRLLEQRRPHAVILDLALPDGSGMEVMERYAKHGRSGTTFVVLTNHVDPPTRRRALVAGADFFFDKSRDVDRVLSTVARLAGGRMPSVAGEGAGS